jgi:hypothetical protein
MLNLEYTTKPDYSKLNPPKFVQISKKYNTVLLPLSYINTRIAPADTVSFIYNNKTIKQKAGLDSGTINFYNKEYYYFYLIPGFSEYVPDYILINDQKIKLSKYFDPQYRAKIFNGLLVLPNNFTYLFGHTNYSILLSNNKNIFTKILKQQNKYNYYAANTNNTLLHILHPDNTNSIYELNNSYENSYIRPLFNKNYPLGKCTITAKGVINIRIKVKNNIFKFNETITVDYLPCGKYNIVFLDDDNNAIKIDTINGKNWNTTTFDIDISQLSRKSWTSGQSIIEPVRFQKPKKDFGNLLINIYPYNTKFEIIGPNNFYKKFDTGYQQITNLEPGKYNIKYKNTMQEILIIKNDNNYFSNL